MQTFSNPILPGCHPDPSICRVGDDYFLVTSTFEYLPGLPVFHSRDLVHWRQVGAGIDRGDQLDLSSVPSSGGLFAPTLRHHNGLFYLVCTLVHGAGRQGHFVLTATDAAGPWSDPVWMDDAHGIDPSLFFDTDGRAWFTATRLASPGQWHDQTEVWIRELDLATLHLTGDETVLWTGALHGAVWAEGPHLYRVNDRYYLLASEGGTEHNHAVSVAVADSVTGPYVGNPGNPVLTHRHLGRGYPITGTGHADLVDDADGNWWAVLLASRPYGHDSGGDSGDSGGSNRGGSNGGFANLGRETMLVPISWEDGWPVFSPGTGKVEASYPSPVQSALHDDLLLPDDSLLRDDSSPQAMTERDDFGATTNSVGNSDCDCGTATLAGRWSTPRSIPSSIVQFDARPGWLRLPLRESTLADVAVPAFVGRRQQHFTAELTALVDFDPVGPNDEAGLAVRQSEDSYLTLLIGRAPSGSGRQLVASARTNGVTTVLGTAALPPGDVILSIRADGQDYHLGYVAAAAPSATPSAATSSDAVPSAAGTPPSTIPSDPARRIDVAVADGRPLSSQLAGGFLGVWMGPYATSNGAPTTASADIRWINYSAPASTFHA